MQNLTTWVVLLEGIYVRKESFSLYKPSKGEGFMQTRGIEGWKG
jgi:hypothetical protein